MAELRKAASLDMQVRVCFGGGRVRVCLAGRGARACRGFGRIACAIPSMHGGVGASRAWKREYEADRWSACAYSRTCR